MYNLTISIEVVTCDQSVCWNNEGVTAKGIQKKCLVSVSDLQEPFSAILLQKYFAQIIAKSSIFYSSRKHPIFIPHSLSLQFPMKNFFTHFHCPEITFFYTHILLCNLEHKYNVKRKGYTICCFCCR